MINEKTKQLDGRDKGRNKINTERIRSNKSMMPAISREFLPRILATLIQIEYKREYLEIPITRKRINSAGKL